MNKEIRSITAELRAATEGRTIEGYAAVYNQEADLGFFREIIMPGAFDGADMSDVRALFNHNPDGILARTASGTMQLEVDERGLKFRFEAPNTTLGNDLLEMIRRVDISQSSFAFTVAKGGDEWEDGDERADLRKIKKFRALYDVSPVTYPAYTQTSVQARSAEQVYRDAHPDPTPDEVDEDEYEGPDEFEKEQDTLDATLTEMVGKIAGAA